VDALTDSHLVTFSRVRVIWVMVMVWVKVRVDVAHCMVSWQ